MYVIENQAEKIQKMKLQGQRLGQLIEAMGKNQYEFANLLEVTEGYISHIVTGKKPISGGLLLKILDNSQVSRKWLLDDEGEMLIKNNEDVQLEMNTKGKWKTKEPGDSGIDPKQTPIDMNTLLQLNAEMGLSVIKEDALAVYDSELLSKRLDSPPVAWLNHPIFTGCDTIIRARGDRMTGEIEEGGWIGVKKIEDWKEYFLSGIYLAVTNNFEIMGFMTREQEFLMAKFRNEKYPLERIPIKKIEEMWSVKTSYPAMVVKTHM